MRFVIAMHMGCIPVVTSDHVVQPLEGVVPFEEFAVRVPNRDLPHLVALLRAIPAHERARLRLGMAKWHRAFIWCALMPSSSGKVALRGARVM